MFGLIKLVKQSLQKWKRNLKVDKSNSSYSRDLSISKGFYS